MSRFQLDSALRGSPYSIDAAGAAAVADRVRRIEDRVSGLRAAGKLTPGTLERYYGQRRFEQVAESNAIEGSTLSVGETELAIMKGVTLTGHDEGYVRDARALDRALQRLAEMAREPGPTDILQTTQLHELILQGRRAAGALRTDPVRIRGSNHRPPKTWADVMAAMEQWENWSRERTDLPAPLRAAVLHAWLAWVHPFTDGNGRTARAITNLELIRAGYPPAIIRKRQDRTRYISSLGESDEAGDLGPFLELMFDRVDAALTGLELSAREKEGYDRDAALLRESQRGKVAIWNRSVELLYEIVSDRLAETLGRVGGTLDREVFEDALTLEDYTELCSGRAISRSWAFRLKAFAPGLRSVERLCWVGYRSAELCRASGEPDTLAPSLYWSKRNTESYPPWERSVEDAPSLSELSISPGHGDEWHAFATDGRYRAHRTTEAAASIVSGLVALMND